MSRKFIGSGQRKQATLRVSNNRPRLKVSFTAGALSPFGGLPAVAKVEKLYGLVEGAAAKIVDHRTQALIDYNKLQLLKQCVFLTTTGNPDTNDADRHRLDPALIEALGLEEGESVASQPTVCRFLNEISKEDLEGMAEWLVEFYLRNHAVKPKRVYLYADGTAVETYGKQEGAVWRGGKYKKEMYFPLTVFDQEGWLLAATLRPGYQSEARTILKVVEGLVTKMRARWPHVEIVLVVDGAFKSSELLGWCEKNNVYYLAGYANTSAVQSKLKDEKKVVERLFKKEHGKPRFTGPKGGEKAQEEHARIRDIADPKERMSEEHKLAARRVRLIGETTHKATTWPKEDPFRRLIFRVDYTDKAFDTRCILTNFTAYNAEQLYKMYCQRGASETWIGEFKNCFNLKFNSQRFRANQLRLFIHGLAYMLLWLLRRSCSAQFHKWSLLSIRKMFVEIPVAATYKPGHTLWEMTDRFSYQTEFLRVTRKLERAG